MTITPDISAKLSELIQRISSDAAAHDWQRDLARRFKALPVYGDIGGALLICTDGTVLGVSWDDESKATPAPLDWSLIAYAAAGYKFPELNVTPPQRPDAGWVSCFCCGRDVGVGLGCTHCFGLGWQYAMA